MKITSAKKSFTISNLTSDDLLDMYYSDLPVKFRRKVYQSLLDSLDEEECMAEYGISREQFLENINVTPI